MEHFSLSSTRAIYYSSNSISNNFLEISSGTGSKPKFLKNGVSNATYDLITILTTNQPKIDF